MVRVESDCCDCGLPCIGTSCKYYDIVTYICDHCNDHVNELYYFDGQQLCIDCITDRLEKVEYDEREE